MKKKTKKIQRASKNDKLQDAFQRDVPEKKINLGFVLPPIG